VSTSSPAVDLAPSTSVQVTEYRNEAAGQLFVRRQRRLADPLGDLRLFREPYGQCHAG
jgi:hypothetical protein